MILTLCLAGAARAQEAKLDLDRIFGMTRAELSRYIPTLAENVNVEGWKGFRQVGFSFNARNRLVSLDIHFTEPVVEADAISALEKPFAFKLYPGKAVRAPAALRFEDVEKGVKEIILPAVKMRARPHTFDTAIIISGIGYND